MVADGDLGLGVRDNDRAFELERCLGVDDVESFIEEGKVDVESRSTLLKWVEKTRREASLPMKKQSLKKRR